MESQSGGEKPWSAVGQDALDALMKSDDAMMALMLLTPVHFVDGRPRITTEPVCLRI